MLTNSGALEERAKAEALAKSLETHRRWVAELRRQISSIEHEHGVLGSTNDVPAFLVKTAMAFVGAKKGLLLSRKDEDSDGALDLLASQGFQHDPEHSGVAQRFAREVIARDETVRRRARPCRRSRARQTARSRTCSRSRSTSATGSAAWSCSRTSPNREKGYDAGDEAVKKVGASGTESRAGCQAIPARFSGRRIAVVIPRAGDEEARSCGGELTAELAGEPAVQVARVVWQEGDSAEAVVERARRLQPVGTAS